jgi:hypothetical protein
MWLRINCLDFLLTIAQGPGLEVPGDSQNLQRLMTTIKNKQFKVHK